MKKIFLISLLFLAMILAVSSVAGADNATDAVCDVSGDVSDNLEKVDESSKNQVLGQSIPDESDAVVGDGNDSGGNSTSEVVKSKSAVSASKVNGYQSFKIKKPCFWSHFSHTTSFFAIFNNNLTFHKLISLSHFVVFRV